MPSHLPCLVSCIGATGLPRPSQVSTFITYSQSTTLYLPYFDQAEIATCKIGRIFLTKMSSEEAGLDVFTTPQCLVLYCRNHCPSANQLLGSFGRMVTLQWRRYLWYSAGQGTASNGSDALGWVGLSRSRSCQIAGICRLLSYSVLFRSST